MISESEILKDFRSHRHGPWFRGRSSALPVERHEVFPVDHDKLGGQIAAAIAARSATNFNTEPAETLYSDKSPAGFRPVKALDIAQRSALHILADSVTTDSTMSAERFEDFDDFDGAAVRESEQSFIAVADVSHFYDYIPHANLARELVLQGADTSQVQGLISLLRGAVGSSIGIPQTYPGCHKLADLYISIAERRLIRHGYEVWRYNDDFRIGASDFGAATRALELLNIELRSLGLALNDRKTLRFSREKYEERLEGRRTAWETLLDDVGQLGDWATEASPYEEDYTLDADEGGEGEEDNESKENDDLAESLRVIEFFDNALKRDAFVEGQAEFRGDVFVGLMSRALSIIAAARATATLDLEGWLRGVPSLTPWIFRTAVAAEGDARESMLAGLADALADNRIHLNAWQDVWLGWYQRGQTANFPQLNEHLRSVAERSQSSYARTQALRSLLVPHDPDPKVVEQLALEFDRGSSASRELIAGALAGVDGTDAEKLRRTVSQEDALYRVLSRPRRRAKKTARKATARRAAGGGRDGR